MKRRSFLQSIIGGLTALFVGSANLDSKSSDIYAPNNPNSKVKWRKWAKLKKEPEEYTQEDIEAASGYNEEISPPQPLARLDCGEVECIHYRWLGCHCCDDPANQSACALPLEKGYECLMSTDHILFESQAVNARKQYKKQLVLGQTATTKLPGKAILDICENGDYIYVLIEGGELWRARRSGEIFGKCGLTWQKVHQYHSAAETIKYEPFQNGWIACSGKIDGDKYRLGVYNINSPRGV